MPYAHTHAVREWEPLEDHLREVGRIAASYARAFGAGAWGEVLGNWHDLGKYSAAFQDYLRASADPDAGEESAGRVDHSTFGAQHAARMFTGNAAQIGQILAFCIAGHHAGLADARGEEDSTSQASLSARLKMGPPRVPAVALPSDLPEAPALKLPFLLKPGNHDSAGFQVAFFTRMLFSCLIDADRTATERFCDPRRSQERMVDKPQLSALAEALAAFLETKKSNLTAVNRIRSKVLGDCLVAADLPKGFFSLCVPTGGGKTYSSLAFALRHAIHHQLRRVVVAIPFTSIIEQTADAYREAFGDLARLGLVEHHSNIDPKRQTRENQMASENWDAPLIVTTNVQLYESLFAAATSPCRKLHRLANSVIILDEAQTIPLELLRPTLEALKELVRHYGCSVVPCTATQPALEEREDFTIGLSEVRPIIKDASALFSALKRVQVMQLGKLDDDELAQRLAGESSALCVVNTKLHAAKLYDALVGRCGPVGCYHLSTFMCAQHRREKLTEIRQRLKENKTCRLISTQLIEAGVDVDFPAVYRAPAGFDSIAQAAGRCNREGKLDDQGRVYVFQTEAPPPPGLLRSAAQCGQELLGRHADPIAADAIEHYFRLFYWSQKHQWDRFGVMEMLSDDLRRPELGFMFRQAANKYRIIRDQQASVLVPFDAESRQMIESLSNGRPADFQVLRDAQRYVVQVRENLLGVLLNNRLLLEHPSGLWLLLNDDAYSSEKGLSPNVAGFDPELLIG